MKEKVAYGTISGIRGVHKFHFQVILDEWLKVDIQEALMPDVVLMFPNDTTDQNKVGDVVNGNGRWN
jgi:hypothetical protein